MLAGAPLHALPAAALAAVIDIAPHLELEGSRFFGSDTHAHSEQALQRVDAAQRLPHAPGGWAALWQEARRMAANEASRDAPDRYVFLYFTELARACCRSVERLFADAATRFFEAGRARLDGVSFELRCGGDEAQNAFGPVATREEADEMPSRTAKYKVRGLAAMLEAQQTGFVLPALCVVDFAGFRVLCDAGPALESDAPLVHGTAHDGFVFDAAVARALLCTAQYARLRPHAVSRRLADARTGRPSKEFLPLPPVPPPLEVQIPHSHQLRVLRLQSGELRPVLPDLPFPLVFEPGAHAFGRPHIFRLELLRGKSEPLSPDAFLFTGGAHGDTAENDKQVFHAQTHLTRVLVPGLVDRLESADPPLFSCAGLCAAFHREGVPLLCLGQVASGARSADLRSVANLEIIARCFRQAWRQELRRVARAGRGLQARVAEVTADLLNALFGRGVATERFWKTRIGALARKNFLARIEYPSRRLQVLLDRIQTLCGISLVDRAWKFFDNSEVFHDNDLLGFAPQCATPAPDMLPKRGAAWARLEEGDVEGAMRLMTYAAQRTVRLHGAAHPSSCEALVELARLSLRCALRLSRRDKQPGSTLAARVFVDAAQIDALVQRIGDLCAPRPCTPRASASCCVGDEFAWIGKVPPYLLAGVLDHRLCAQFDVPNEGQCALDASPDVYLQLAITYARAVLGLSRRRSVVALRCYSVLSVAALASGDDALSKRCFKLATSVCTYLFGDDSLHLAALHALLTEVLSRRRLFKPALAHAARARTLTGAALGDEHPSLAYALVREARALEKTGEVRPAFHKYRRALSIYATSHGPASLAASFPAARCAGALTKLGNGLGALPYAQRALDARERKLGAAAALTQRSLVQVIGILNLIGDRAGATDSLERYIAVVRKKEGSAAFADRSYQEALALVVFFTLSGASIPRGGPVATASERETVLRGLVEAAQPSKFLQNLLSRLKLRDQRSIRMVETLFQLMDAPGEAAGGGK
eukprot:gnl/Chilomastix_cuspidata/5986.p1 GENE.gnl/Chilomastix_cuspidata/5986~~gnl/Chilomastix_cuspidata/5986.p1  ORF type:complete len:1129 (-),score=352.63 gnl/Chilomastix_cuspidata/5986:86-3070(-)